MHHEIAVSRRRQVSAIDELACGPLVASAASMIVKPTRKLTLKTETLKTLQSTALDYVRGGQAQVDIPFLDEDETERCPPSQSGPATCPVPRRGRSKRF